MNFRRLRALMQKEWREMFKNKMVLLSVIIAPLILLSISVFLLVVFNNSYGDLFAEEEIIAQLQGDWAILLNNILMFFMFMPLVIPLAIAVYSVVGEKEQKSLEPLLATPLTDLEIFVGKALASVLPGLLITWLSFGIFSGLLIYLIPWSFIDLFFQPPWLMAMFGLAPIISIFSVLSAMAISSFTRDTRAAYQLSSLIMIPFLMGSLYYIFTFQGLVSMEFVFLGMASMGGMDVLVLLMGIRLFRREDILTRWN